MRLRDVLEYWLLEQTADPAASRALRRWNKEAKKLRRALQPVRDADVYLACIDGLRASLTAAPDEESKLSPRCRREIDELESWLKKRRQKRIDQLMAVIENRGERLSRLNREIEAVLAPHMPSQAGSMSKAALRIFAALGNDFPVLDSTNLHEYRKRLKPALYLAEISAKNDPAGERMAATFRKIHLATGEWHDWQTLTLKAERILSRHDRQDGLIPVLEKLTEAAMQKALGLCKRSAARLLRGSDEAPLYSQKKPVVSEPGCRPSSELRFLKISS
jgi:hypothetical protein